MGSSLQLALLDPARCLVCFPIDVADILTMDHTPSLLAVLLALLPSPAASAPGPALEAESTAVRFVPPDSLFHVSSDGKLRAVSPRRSHALRKGESLVVPVGSGQTCRILFGSGHPPDVEAWSVQEGGALVPCDVSKSGDDAYLLAPPRGCFALEIVARNDGVSARIQKAIRVARPLFWERSEIEALRAIDAGEELAPDGRPSSEDERKVQRLLRKARYLHDIEEAEREDPALFDIEDLDLAGPSIETESPGGNNASYTRVGSLSADLEGPRHVRIRARLCQAPHDGTPVALAASIDVDSRKGEWKPFVALDRRDRRPHDVPFLSAPAETWIRVGPGRHRLSLRFEGDVALSAQVWRRRRRPSLSYSSSRDTGRLLRDLESAASALPSGSAIAELVVRELAPMLSPAIAPAAEPAPPSKLYETVPAETLPSSAPTLRLDPARAESFLARADAPELPDNAWHQRGSATLVTARARYAVGPGGPVSLVALLPQGGSPATAFVSLDGGDEVLWPVAHDLQELALGAPSSVTVRWEPKDAPLQILISPGADEGSPVHLRVYRRLGPGQSASFVIPDAEGTPRPASQEIRLLAWDGSSLSVAVEGSAPIPVRFSPLLDEILRLMDIGPLERAPSAALDVPASRHRVVITNTSSRDALLILQRRLSQAP